MVDSGIHQALHSWKSRISCEEARDTMAGKGPDPGEGGLLERKVTKSLWGYHVNSVVRSNWIKT